MSNEQQNSLRDRCFNFTHALIKQLRQRLPENIDLLLKIALLRPSNALNPIKDSIVPLLEGMGVAPDDIDEIARQWSNLPFIRWQQTSTPVALWSEIRAYRDAGGDNLFSKLACFALKMLCLPFSNAEVERMFSQLNIVKNKLRNRLLPETTTAIL
jgi:hAT family C-terminal dimerisation region